MKCKAGDTAIVIAAAEPGFVGSVCKVVEYGGEYARFTTGELYAGWICEWPRPMPWMFPSPCYPLNKGWMPDAWLQPLPPDESVREADSDVMQPKPQREFAR